jgi:hypothetical protein
MHFARHNGQADVTQRVNATEGFADAADVEEEVVAHGTEETHTILTLNIDAQSSFGTGKLFENRFLGRELSCCELGMRLGSKDWGFHILLVANR